MSDADAHLRFGVGSRGVRSVSFEFKPVCGGGCGSTTCAITTHRGGQGRHDVAVAAARSIAMDRSGVKRKARYSIFSRRDDGSLLLDTSATSSDDARTPAPAGRPFRSGLLLTVVAIVALLAIPKIFHITVTLPRVSAGYTGDRGV